MTFYAITPSSVSNGDEFPAATYNTIVSDINDHESRLTTAETNITTNTTNILKGVQSYTTTQRDALTGVTTGTQIYNSTKGIMEVYNGTAWTTPFLYAYSSGSFTNTNSLSWPTGSKVIVLKLDMSLTSGTPDSFNFAFNGVSGSTYSGSYYTFAAAYSRTTYGGVNFAGGFVSYGGTITLEFDIGSAVNYPNYKITQPITANRSSGTFEIQTGAYGSNANTPTGITLYQMTTNGSTLFNYRMYVMS